MAPTRCHVRTIRTLLKTLTDLYSQSSGPVLHPALLDLAPSSLLVRGRGGGGEKAFAARCLMMPNQEAAEPLKRDLWEL